MERIRNILKKIRREGLVWLFARLLLSVRSSSIVERVSVTVSKKKSNSGELFAVYDLNVQPLSFNFIQFMLCAEYYCIKNGRKSYSIVVVPKDLHPSLDWKEMTDSYGSDALEYRSTNFFNTLATLGPKCSGFLSFSTRQAAKQLTSSEQVFPEGYGFSNIGSFDARLHTILRNEGVFCELRVPKHLSLLMDQWHKFYSGNTRLVTITIRNSKFDQIRNSRIPEWVQFAEYLQSQGFEPIIIPDADQPFDDSGMPIKFTDIGFAAAYNQGTRLYLYQKAFVNFFVPNGPCYLGFYSSNVRYIQMKAWLKDSCISPPDMGGYDWVDPLTSRAYWANELQMLNGDDDTFDNIKKHFDEFCSRVNGKV